MHLLRRLFVSVTLTACACALLPAQDRFAELARVAEQVRAEIGSPGLSIALELDGKQSRSTTPCCNSWTPAR